MSKHNIHGINVEISVHQGDLSDQSRGRCIGKVVNLCRDMPADDFAQCMADMRNCLQGSAKSAAMLGMIDEQLAASYTPRYTDDYAPIASIKEA